MKKLFYLVAAVGLLFAACDDYDDTGINDRIDDLEERVTTLEETIASLNQDIAGVQTLVDAMQNNVYVSKIVKGETGYEVYFTNGEKIEIADGKAGEAGKDGVTVTVMLDEEDGQYYWAVTKDGMTTFIEVDGKRLPVKGEKGNTPQMRVTMEGETGYWEVSYDNGETWERVLLEDGTPVTTSGGAGGLFKEAYVDEDTNTAVFVFLNGETLEIELRSDLYINFKGEAVESADFMYGETKTFEMEAVGVLKTVVTTPDEWKASYDKETMVWTITAPTAEHAACADKEGEVSLIYFGEENQSSVVSMKVQIGEYVTVADEHLTIEATADEATYEVPYTADGEVTVEQVDAWISATLVDGVAQVKVEANPGAERTGTIKLVAKSNEVVITVNQPDGVKLQPYGYRAGSEAYMWSKDINEVAGYAAGDVHIAALQDYLIVSSPYKTPTILNALTGEVVGDLNLGAYAGQNTAITADDAGNIVIAINDGSNLNFVRMKGINGTPELFIESTKGKEYGKDISAVGDVYGNAIISTVYYPWFGSPVASNLAYVVQNGVYSTVNWCSPKAGDTGLTLGKTSSDAGDVIFRDADPAAPLFVGGYSPNTLPWVEGGVALAGLQPYSADAFGANNAIAQLDIEEFNGAKYLMAVSAAHGWCFSGSSAYVADVTTIENFKAGAIELPYGPLFNTTIDWDGGGSPVGYGDCAMRVSKDGIYMHIYIALNKNTVACMRVDCLLNAPEE